MTKRRVNSLLTKTPREVVSECVEEKYADQVEKGRATTRMALKATSGDAPLRVNL